MANGGDVREVPALLAALTPAGVAVAECLSDTEPAQLFPAERRAIERALSGRRREFATARLCARRAMVALGHPPQEVTPGESGAPVWPRGLVGSITHCAGYRGAALARSDDYSALGIDAEPLGPPLAPGVLELIATDDERRRLHALAAATGLAYWDRLLFSAKESVYKAWFPLAGATLWFTNVDVHLHGRGSAHPADRGRFTATVDVEGPWVAGERVQAIAGQWIVTGGLLLTLVAV